MGACHHPHHVAVRVDAGERGEASPAVSINEPSLDGALISHCTGAVLFTVATSLTLLIPKGFFFFFLPPLRGRAGRSEETQVRIY